MERPQNLNMFENEEKLTLYTVIFWRGQFGAYEDQSKTCMDVCSTIVQHEKEL